MKTFLRKATDLDITKGNKLTYYKNGEEFFPEFVESLKKAEKFIFIGTINFDFRSLTHHFECGMTFLDAPCLPEVKKDFEEMIEASEKVPTDFKMKGFARFIAGILKMFRVLF